MKDTEIPAFPNTDATIPREGEYWNYQGMTLRDYFAAKAMQSILRGYDVVTSFEEDEVNDPEGMPTLIAIDAYKMADAMLKARQE